LPFLSRQWGPPRRPPLNKSFVYLVFSKKYYDAHREACERFWSEMARVRNSQDYADEISGIHFDE
jgi:hypothetical protein